jgi:hypothetical protein
MAADRDLSRVALFGVLGFLAVDLYHYSGRWCRARAASTLTEQYRENFWSTQSTRSRAPNKG